MVLPEQIIIYGSVLITVALSLLLIAVVTLYVSLLRKYQELLEEKSKLQSIREGEVEKILAEARQKAHQIVEEANVNASKIVQDAGFVNEELKGKMLAELERVSSEFFKNYQGALKGAEAQALATITDISKNLGSEAAKQIEAMRQVLQAEIARAQQTTKAAIDEAYKKVEEEIEAYRKSRLQKIDEQIYEVIKKVSQDVIGKAIEAQEHEEMVVKSLEEAKRQNIF